MIDLPRQYFPELKKACKMGVSGAKEVKFTTDLSLLQEEKFNRAQTHRWHSGKYYCWDAILFCNRNEYFWQLCQKYSIID